MLSFKYAQTYPSGEISFGVLFRRELLQCYLAAAGREPGRLGSRQLRVAGLRDVTKLLASSLCDLLLLPGEGWAPCPSSPATSPSSPFEVVYAGSDICTLARACWGGNFRAGDTWQRCGEDGMGSSVRKRDRLSLLAAVVVLNVGGDVLRQVGDDLDAGAV